MSDDSQDHLKKFRFPEINPVPVEIRSLFKTQAEKPKEPVSGRNGINPKNPSSRKKRQIHPKHK